MVIGKPSRCKLDHVSLKNVKPPSNRRRLVTGLVHWPCDGRRSPGPLRYLGESRSSTDMIENPMTQTCPICEAMQEPMLVIRSSGVSTHGWLLRCRSCDHEWPHTGVGAEAPGP